MISRRSLARHAARVLRDQPERRDQLITELAAYLISRKQPGQAPLLVEDILRQFELNYGAVQARVTSARPLEQDIKDQIAELIRTQFSAGSVTLSEAVDLGLIGGFIVDTPSIRIDESVRGKLDRLKNNSRSE